MAENIAARGSNLSPTHFIDLVAELRTAQREIDRATGRKRAVLKRCKSDGVHLDALAMLQRLAKLETEEATTLLKTVHRYSAWLSMPIGMQPDLFTDQPAPLDAEARSRQDEFTADDAGYRAGKAGHSIDGNPYRAGTSEYDQWRRAWFEGQATLAPKQAKPETAAKGRKNGKQAAPAEPDSEDEAEAPTSGVLFGDDPPPVAAKRGRGRPPKLAVVPPSPPARTAKRGRGAESRRGAH
jgi:ribosome modulation factor